MTRARESPFCRADLPYQKEQQNAAGYPRCFQPVKRRPKNEDLKIYRPLALIYREKLFNRGNCAGTPGASTIPDEVVVSSLQLAIRWVITGQMHPFEIVPMNIGGRYCTVAGLLPGRLHEGVPWMIVPIQWGGGEPVKSHEYPHVPDLGDLAEWLASQGKTPHPSVTTVLTSY